MKRKNDKYTLEASGLSDYEYATLNTIAMAYQCGMREITPKQIFHINCNSMDLQPTEYWINEIHNCVMKLRNTDRKNIVTLDEESKLFFESYTCSEKLIKAVLCETVMTNGTTEISYALCDEPCYKSVDTIREAFILEMNKNIIECKMA